MVKPLLKLCQLKLTLLLKEMKDCLLQVHFAEGDSLVLDALFYCEAGPYLPLAKLQVIQTLHRLFVRLWITQSVENRLQVLLSIDVDLRNLDFI